MAQPYYLCVQLLLATPSYVIIETAPIFLGGKFKVYFYTIELKFCKKKIFKIEMVQTL